jgi:hypothetical protein
MKYLLKIFVLFISLTGSAVVTMKINSPEFLKHSAESCPLTLNMVETPVMVVRVIDNTNLPKDFIKRCMFSQMTVKNGVVFVNRENEPQILNELARQSDIPSSQDHVQPIGEILVPSHLYVINQKESWIEVSLSEIKSGIYVIKEEFQYHKVLETLKTNSDFVFKSIAFIFSFLISYFLVNSILRPIYRWLDHQEKVALLTRKYEQAKYFLSQNNMYAAGDLLVECAKSPIDCQSRSSAKSILKDLSKMVKE